MSGQSGQGSADSKSREEVEALFDEVTAWLIDELKQNRPPWRRPWGPVVVRIGGRLWPTAWPSNIRTPDKLYNVMNRTLLDWQMHKRGQFKYRSNLFITPGALKSLGVEVPTEESYFVMNHFPVGYVRQTEAGEDGHQLSFDNLPEGVGGDTRKLPRRYVSTSDYRYRVRRLYHVEQVPDCEKALGFGLPVGLYKITYTESERALEALQERQHLRIVDGKPYAAYHPRTDVVSMPTLAQFVSTQEDPREGESHFWCTMWHEVVHWTGHRSRLERSGKSYAVEELVAESGAAYLCSHFGIEGRLQHGAYLGSWLEDVEGDRWRILSSAFWDGQRAVEWIIKESKGSRRGRGAKRGADAS